MTSADMVECNSRIWLAGGQVEARECSRSPLAADSSMHVGESKGAQMVCGTSASYYGGQSEWGETAQQSNGPGPIALVACASLIAQLWLFSARNSDGSRGVRLHKAIAAVVQSCRSPLVVAGP